MGEPYDFKVVEGKALKLWQDKDTYRKSKERNKGKPKFYFLQGPPYTSGKPHIGHAWNNTMKDWVLRYKRMRGLDVWDRAGYDQHGLPTENAVQKMLGLKEKSEIEDYGVEAFTKECLKWSLEKAKEWSDEIRRWGVWMGFEDPYMPVTPEYTEGVWWAIKKARENDRLYKGKKVMTWCSQCETGLAKHELEYEQVTDTSIYLKFKLKGTNEYLIVWTTTPWTIPFNLAVMVNPEMVYQKCKVGDEVWIVSKPLAAAVIANITGKQFGVIEEVKGKELEGLQYLHPLDVPAFKELESRSLHTVILSEKYVDASAGSGLVHCAPGCGPEDNEVGQEYGLPPFNNLNEMGVFEDMGKYSGKRAKIDDAFFIQELRDSGALIYETPVEHDYPHCWRCKRPVVFRATEQWFLRVEDLIPKLENANRTTLWVPKSAGNRYEAWVKNLKDNSIARQRFWGTPVPVWECGCGNVKVVASVDELRKEGGDNIPEEVTMEFVHRPFIDRVTLPCDCGKRMKRIPDVLDVWIDSGTASWNCLKSDERLLERYYPADFIIEATEQARLWFSQLNIWSFVTMDRPAFKSVYNHGMILDYQGTKMSKSLGNVISPYEVIDKVGVDVMRFYFGSTPAGQNISFSWDECKNEQRNLMVLWNLHNLLIDVSDDAGINPAELAKESCELGVEEHYMLSRLQSAIAEATTYFDEYQLDKVPAVLRDLWLSLSREYVQFTRDKAAVGTEQERKAVLFTLYNTLMAAVKMLSPIGPFIAEGIFQDLKVFGLGEESVHLCSWPELDRSLRDEQLEHQMRHALNVMTAINAARDRSNVGLRWPLSRVMVLSKSEETRESVEELADLIKTQCNIKEVTPVKSLAGLKYVAKLNIAGVGKSFGNLAPRIIAAFAPHSSEEVVEKLQKEGKFTLKLEDVVIDLLPEHVHITRQVPAPFVEADFPNGYVYIDPSLTPELEDEGFAREVTRKLQSLRKDAGLVKSDAIAARVVCSEKLQRRLEKWKHKIMERCGAEMLDIITEPPEEPLPHTSEEKVKQEAFRIGLAKI